MMNKAHGHAEGSCNGSTHRVLLVIGVLVVIISNCEGLSTPRLSPQWTASTSVSSRLRNVNSPLPSARGSTWELSFAAHRFPGENESEQGCGGATTAPWKTAAPGVESLTGNFKVSTIMTMPNTPSTQCCGHFDFLFRPLDCCRSEGAFFFRKGAH